MDSLTCRCKLLVFDATLHVCELLVHVCEALSCKLLVFDATLHVCEASSCKLPVHVCEALSCKLLVHDATICFFFFCSILLAGGLGIGVARNEEDYFHLASRLARASSRLRQDGCALSTSRYAVYLLY